MSTGPDEDAHSRSSPRLKKKGRYQVAAQDSAEETREDDGVDDNGAESFFGDLSCVADGTVDSYEDEEMDSAAIENYDDVDPESIPTIPENDDNYDDVPDEAKEVEEASRKQRLTSGKTTARTYYKNVAPFISFCHNQGKSHAVTPNKTLMFLRAEQTRELKRRSQFSGQVLSFKSMSGKVSAIIDLWDSQLHNPAVYNGKSFIRSQAHPRTCAVTQLLKMVLDSECARLMSAGRDTTGDSLSDGFDDVAVIATLCDNMLEEGAHVKLRTRADFLVGHHTVSRGDDKRKLSLWNLSTWTAPFSVGPTPCTFLILGLPDHHSRKCIGSAPYLPVIRNKNPSLCGAGACALYMWFRYHKDLGREPFPDFENKHSWCSVKLFVNSRANSTEERSNSLALNTEYKHIKSDLDAADIKSNQK